MKPAHPAVGPTNGQGQSCGNIFWKLGVIACGERQLPFKTYASGGETHRAFSGNMDGVRLVGEHDFAHLFVTAECQLDLRIIGPGYGLEQVKVDDLNIVAKFDALFNGAFKGRHDPVDLWFPRIGGE